MGSPLKYEIARNRAQLDLAEQELARWQERVDLLRNQLDAKSALLEEERERIQRTVIINP